VTEPLWDDCIASVVLLPGGDRGERMLSIAEDWVGSWLLAPAIWVRVVDVRNEQGNAATIEDGRPPRVIGTMIGRNGRREVDLFRELGRVELKTLRLLVVRWVDQGAEFEGQTHDELQDQIVEVISVYVQHARPQLLNHDDGARVGTDLIKINLVFAPTEREGGSAPHLLEDSWEANVVVAPEDRPTPASFDAFTRAEDEGTMDRFILANAVTAAGLWPGLNKSVYEMHTNNAPAQGILKKVVMVQRVFVRGILSDGLAFRSAGRALISAVEAESPLLDPMLGSSIHGLELLDPQENSEAISRMLTTAMAIDSGHLAYMPFRPFMAPRKGKAGLLPALGEFVRFCKDKLRATPGWLFDSAVAFWSKFFSRTLYSKDGDTEIDGTIDFGKSRSLLDKNLEEQTKLIKSRKARLQEAATVPLPLGRHDVNPQTWKALRQLMFAVLDGSPGPEIVGVETVQAPPRIDTSAARGSGSLFSRMRDGLKRRGQYIDESSLNFGKSAATRSIKLPSLTPFSEDGFPRVIGDVTYVCPDPKDIWEPPAELVEELAGSELPEEESSGLETSSVHAWVEKLQRKSLELTHRINSHAALMDEVSSGVEKLDSQLEDLGIQLDWAQGQVESLQEEVEIFAPVDIDGEAAGDQIAPDVLQGSGAVVIEVVDEHELELSEKEIDESELVDSSAEGGEG